VLVLMNVCLHEYGSQLNRPSVFSIPKSALLN
jgi:hypothetical protein